MVFEQLATGSFHDQLSNLAPQSGKRCVLTRTKSGRRVAQRKFTILSDSAASVIKQYGLLHAEGHSGGDIAIRTTLLIDPKGLVVWRRVSESVPDIPTADEILQRIKQALEQTSGVRKNHWYKRGRRRAKGDLRRAEAPGRSRCQHSAGSRPYPRCSNRAPEHLSGGNAHIG